MHTTIPGLSIIKLNSSQIDEPENPELPWKLEVTFAPPQFMTFTFTLLHGGTEDLVVQAETREQLDRFMQEEELSLHPRLIRAVFTGPDDFREEVTRENSCEAD